MYSTMKYDTGQGNTESWIVSETAFNAKYLGKCEVVMSTGNGYMGLRSAHEESYAGEIRNLFVNGTFNKAFDNEVTELPNAADVTRMEIEINGELFNLERGVTKGYRRDLKLRSGEVTRTFIWISPRGDEVKFTFRRFVSMADLHIIGQRLEIEPLSSNVTVKLKSGIDGRMTNSGAQHFIEGEKRLHHNKYMQLVQTTSESKVDFVINTVHKFLKGSVGFHPDKGLIRIERRKIYFEYQFEAAKGETVFVEKISNLYTSRDKELLGCSLPQIKKISLDAIISQTGKGYSMLFEESKKAWEERVWHKLDIEIDSENTFDQLAVRFAIYHLFIMTPAHDNRMGVGATGLCGEGYKGHSFWDTELFILPYWVYNKPEVARSLLEYRYLSLHGARRKARENGYSGAQFPWESAWLEDGEVTPLRAGVDIVTGEEEKVWTGIRALHISSDIVYAIWQYYNATKDQDFMDKCGYEIVFDTAKFWQSRLEWKEEQGNYQITGTMGPDEYKENVDNNAFTNYMAHWNISLAIGYYEQLKKSNLYLFYYMSEKLDLEGAYKLWIDKVDRIYLPKPNEDLIIPQSDNYLSLKQVDLSKYKNQEVVGSVRDDYSLKELQELQVSKQADVLILFYLLEDLFNEETKKENFYFYEASCLHDSSLSLSCHSILASDLKEKTLAYSLFERAARIDLGPNMNTNNNGIHAASMGGMWQCVVNGFGGVRMNEGKLRIEPNLPDKWRKLKFPLMWSGDMLIINISKAELQVENVTRLNSTIDFIYKDRVYRLTDKAVIELK